MQPKYFFPLWYFIDTDLYFHNLKWYYVQFSLQKFGCNCIIVQNLPFRWQKTNNRQCQQLTLMSKKCWSIKKTAPLYFSWRSIPFGSFCLFSFLCHIFYALFETYALTLTFNLAHVTSYIPAVHNATLINW